MEVEASMIYPKTFIFDIDGTLVKHLGSLEAITFEGPEILPGVRKKLDEIYHNGGYILLITARPPSMENLTRQQLEKLGIIYNTLVMGVTHGCRYLVNDTKSDMNTTAVGITVERNKGLEELDI